MISDIRVIDKDRSRENTIEFFRIVSKRMWFVYFKGDFSLKNDGQINIFIPFDECLVESTPRCF